ncbi:MAG: HD domain-containing protein [Patescibacteria group bacterium]
MITLSSVKSNPLVAEYIRQTEIYAQAIGYTDHGTSHSEIVSSRARELAQSIGLSEVEQELAAIAGWCHDMGNFLGRTQHHYWGALLFGQVFSTQADPAEVATIMQAIADHDKEDITIPGPIVACLVIADKSDVRQSRVFDTRPSNLSQDIHDRVNYAVTQNELTVDNKNKIIALRLMIDTEHSPIMEYFEIFAERMAYCRHAAAKLGYKLEIVINETKLL